VFGLFRLPNQLVDRFAGEQLTGQCGASLQRSVVSDQWSLASVSRATHTLYAPWRKEPHAPDRTDRCPLITDHLFLTACSGRGPSSSLFSSVSRAGWCAWL
jgi:hypothetical protein